MTQLDIALLYILFRRIIYLASIKIVFYYTNKLLNIQLKFDSIFYEVLFFLSTLMNTMIETSVISDKKNAYNTINFFLVCEL